LFTTWIIFHVVVCIALILVVLMQSAKGEGLAGSMFGGGGVGGAVFGGRGAASFLSKATTILAVLFMLNCGALAFMSANRAGASAAGGAAASESPITRQAQAERERALEQQAQQQQQPVDQAPAGNTTEPIQVTPNEQQSAPATEDASGK